MKTTKHQWAAWLVAACATVVPMQVSSAQTFTVTNTADSGAGSLREALNQANAYGGTATVNFSITGSTINLSSMLPILTNPNGITINGNNNIIDGGSTSNSTGDRVFFLGVPDNTPAAGGGSMPSTAATNWSITNLTIQNGNGRGGHGVTGGAGLGGGIFVNAGHLTLANVVMSNNRAIGGISSFGGGGGGGMGGNGLNEGGGGFGLGADGGAHDAAGGAGRFTGGASGANGTGASGGINGGGGGGGTGSGIFTGDPGGGGVGASGLQGGFGGGGAGSGNGGFGGGGGLLGNGGFGGGGGSRFFFSANPGFGGGSGSPNLSGPHGGGLGAGGAIFVRQGATLTVQDGGLSGGTVLGGTGYQSGQAIGSGMFLAGSVNYSVSNGNTVTIADTLGGGSDAQITGGFTKSGAGTLVLSGNNSYTGGTTISGGILSIDADNRLGGAGTLTLNGGTLRTTSTMTTSRATTLTNTLSNMDVASGTFTHTGVISGTGRLIKQGPGTLELTGNNSFSGGLVANGGSISLTGTNAFGTGLFSVNTASVSIPEGSVSNGNGFIGQASGTTGSVTVGGASGTSSWVNNGNLQIGQQGNGTLTVTGGGSLYSIFAFLGGNPSGVGTVNLGGGTGASAWNTGLLSVGDRGRGTLHLTGGGVITSSEGMIGREFTSQGVANVGGGTGAAVWHLSTSLTVGHLGEGVLNITGGGTVSSATATIGGGIDGGTVNVGGGTGASTWNNAGSLIVGTVGRGTLNINSGGTVTTGGLSGGNISSRVRLNGGILRITGTDTASNIINVLSSGGTIELPNSGTNFTHTGSMSGSVSLNKTGPGTLTLAGNGNTRLNVIQGHVNVTGNYSAVTGLTFLNQGASIGGTGTLGGSLAGSGLFSPGVNGTGVLSINGPMNMGNFSSFLVELQGTTPGSGHDQISLTGSYLLNNTALLMNRLGDYEAPFLSSFVIVRNSSGSLGDGTFGGLADGDLFDFDGQVFQIRYNVPNNYVVDPTGLQTGYAGITWAGDNGFGINGADNGGNIVIAAVPEPASIMLIAATALLAAGQVAYRRRIGRARLLPSRRPCPKW